VDIVDGQEDIWVYEWERDTLTRVSTDGGAHPTWSRTKQELLFSSNGRIMVSAFVSDGEALRAEKPQPWSETRALQALESVSDRERDSAARSASGVANFSRRALSKSLSPLDRAVK
jgi:hypothetical protein